MQFGLGIVVTVRYGFRRKAREDDRVDCPDACTGEHGDGQFGGHGHVDADYVASGNILRLEHVGELANVLVQLLVGNPPRIARFAFPNNGNSVPITCGNLSVETIVAGVGLAADEPFGIRLMPLHGGMKRFEPV